MSDTALIVPVPRVAPLIQPWASRYDASTRRGVPPHVTVLFPFLPSDEMTTDDVEALRDLFARSPAFHGEFTRVGMFDEREVLHLVPEPATAFRRLHQTVRQRWPELQPYGGQHGSEPDPHLTVGFHIPRPSARHAARSLMLSLPVPFRADVVQLWGGDGDGWQALQSFPLHPVP